MSDEQTTSEVTAVLASAAAGGEVVMDRLVPLIYDELRAMAHYQLVREFGGRTLDTTDLLHETYLKLADQTQATRRGRSYFFGAAARAMRQILVDRARRRTRLKRGGRSEPVSLTPEVAAVDRFSVELLDLDGALRRLSELSRRQVRVVECRYFAGMTAEETAEALEVSPRTVHHDWKLARAWLRSQLERSR